MDTCWDLSGNKIVEPATRDPNSQCNHIYPYFSQPQLEAGQGLTRDVSEMRPEADQLCRLPRRFHAGRTKLSCAASFPNGVCDYSQPGIGEQPLLGTYLLVQ